MSELMLYGVADAPPPEAAWPAEAPLLVRGPGPAAVLGPAPANSPPDLSALRAFAALLDRLWTECRAFLPARYGQRFPDVGAADRWLAELAPVLERRLATVAGCGQITVRLFGPPAAPAPVEGAVGPGTRWLRERAAARSLPEAAPLVSRTRDLVRAERIQRGGLGGVLGTVRHLVPREAAAVYARRCEEVRPALAAAGIRIAVSAPTPPHAFAEGALP